MKVLVTWGSKRGGTEGIARFVARSLTDRGFDVLAISPEGARDVGSFDAIIVGGALYANRWPANIRHFVTRNVKELRRVPVWFFSSGPLDDSADHEHIPATAEVAQLAELVGARGHITFGGRLEADAKGFPASAMAKKNAGDWRNPARIEGWATSVADALPTALPGTPVDQPGRAASRLLTHGFGGWVACAATMGLLMTVASEGAAIGIHAVVAPIVFAILAWHYFGLRGSREPLLVAAVWTLMVGALDLLVVAGLFLGSLEMFANFSGTWLPLGLIFAVTWGTGAMMKIMPERRPDLGEGRRHGAHQ